MPRPPTCWNSLSAGSLVPLALGSQGHPLLKRPWMEARRWWRQWVGMPRLVGGAGASGQGWWVGPGLAGLGGLGGLGALTQICGLSKLCHFTPDDEVRGGEEWRL